MDALEYLRGYVLHNIEKKLTRKKDTASIIILQCFKSDGVEDQPLVALLSRGGLVGITPQRKSMFLKAEKIFREFTSRSNPQNIDCKAMIKILMRDVDVISCINISTQYLENIDKELLMDIVGVCL